MQANGRRLVALLTAALFAATALAPAATAADPPEPAGPEDPVVCDTDLATGDGDAHAWCALGVPCAQVVWGAAVGPVRVGGNSGCQAGVWFDEDGHEDSIVAEPILP